MVVSRDIPVPYDVEGFGAVKKLKRAVRDFSNALVEVVNLVWVVLAQVFIEPGVVTELVMLKSSLRLGFVDGKSPFGDGRVRKLETRGSIGRDLRID